MKNKIILTFTLCLCTAFLIAQTSFDIALDYLQQRGEYSNSDLSDLSISDEYQSDHNGITHLYLQQRYQGVDIIHSIYNFSIKSSELKSATGSFISNVEQKINSAQPDISATQALQKVIQSHQITGQIPSIIETSANTDHKTVFDKGIIAYDNINARLVYLNVEASLKLCWEINLYEKTCQNAWITYVDAETTEVLAEYNQVIHCSFHKGKKGNARSKVKHLAEIVLKKNATFSNNCYNVWAPPVESPIHGPRTLEFDPYPPGPAGTLGWHDDGTSNYTDTRGNNVDAYEDQDASNSPSPPFPRATGGPLLNFNAPIFLNQNPLNNPAPYIINLFYWNNIMHDVWYQYGFTEAAGNFQEDNLSMGGLGSDYVQAEAQDGSGTNNANFFTPVDGQNPRMQMYLWDPIDPLDPPLDSDLDNGIIAHEYGHGISNRLTGGPSNTSCLNNAEQMGEGWSDFFGIWMTIEPGDNHTDSRGVGNYVEELGINGDGIRLAPYTTDMSVNAYTYGNTNDGNVPQPHGIGFIWCTMIWELNWALVNHSPNGLDMDLYFGTGGNNDAAQLIMDGLALQPCSPGFVDGRDAILTANTNNGGSQQYTNVIWNVFARRGLGFSASQGSSNSRFDQVEAFDLPPGIPLMTEAELFDLAPLPVEMTIFNAVANDNKQTIELYWSTLSERNNKGFDIQRRAASQNAFETIGWLDGKIESNIESIYLYDDENVKPGTEYYYRLRQVDISEKENYSEVVHARLQGTAAEVQVFPNPTDGYSTVQFSTDITGKVKLQILNAHGQIILTSVFDTTGGAELEVNLSQQPEGIYFLKFDIGGKQYIKRIVLKK